MNDSRPPSENCDPLALQSANHVDEATVTICRIRNVHSSNERIVSMSCERKEGELYDSRKPVPPVGTDTGLCVHHRPDSYNPELVRFFEVREF
jgi:hypothetical protein